MSVIMEYSLFSTFAFYLFILKLVHDDQGALGINAIKIENEVVAVPLKQVGARVAVELEVGGQKLLMALDTALEGLRLFPSGSSACHKTASTIEVLSVDKDVSTTFNTSQQGQQPILDHVNGFDRNTKVDGTGNVQKFVQSNGKEPNKLELLQDIGKSRSQDGVMQITSQKSAEYGDPILALGYDKIQTGNGIKSKEKGVDKAIDGLANMQQLISTDRDQCYDRFASKQARWCNNSGQTCSAFNDRPFECVPSVDADFSAAAVYRHNVDGLKLTSKLLEGMDDVALTLGGSVTFKRSNFPVKLVAARQTIFEPYFGVDGIWGIAGAEACCRNESLWTTFIQENKFLAVGFDINLSLEKAGSTGNDELNLSDVNAVDQKGLRKKNISTLYLAPNVDAFVKMNEFADIQWAERVQTGPVVYDSIFHFSTYDWEMCGERIMHPLTTHLEAVVDLSSECLVVPHPLWTSLRHWLPLDLNSPLCSELPSSILILSESMKHLHVGDKFGLTETNFAPPIVLEVDSNGDPQKVMRRTCPILRSGEDYLPIDGSSQNSSERISVRLPFPSISFSLTQDGPSSDRVSIPLESLVMPMEGQELLCVVPQRSMAITSGEWRQVRLGTRALKTLLLVMDEESNRIGLKMKNRGLNTTTSNDACLPSMRNSCIGAQRYVPGTNECVDPVCSDWLFFELDDNTKVCSLAWWFPGLITTTVAILVAMEFTVIGLRRRLITNACANQA